ncbi:hypothetical protein JTE90_013624 [Oedothorax gibbosus]|uniref:Valine--tRNA ligase n=1 Tax=Oedothorax gibbosus TaxID=931172 RepID=A0AAV6TY40_9ARAC|nr:hypothetical protein JTE90_013624 [Oedothorax gibbosus]
MFIKSSKFLNNKISFCVLKNSYQKFHKGSSVCCISNNIKSIKAADYVDKDFSGPYPAAYDPKEVERGWYQYWEKTGLLHSEAARRENKAEKSEYSIVLPPPNITGNLHIGHTLTVTIQDCIARWRRMRGQKVVWIPGFDHGGIATQTVVEKKLFKERKITRRDIGREQFLKEIDQWKVLTQHNIENQMKKLGASLDFNKSSFTMDANASAAVNKVFIKLFEEKLIYRKERLVNWSSEIRSVISDIEVDHIEVPGNKKVRIPGLKDPVVLGLMDYFYYPVADSNEKVLIATTRLETMLGDSAIAVNPNDSRFYHLIGKNVKHPYTGEHLPIIPDESINKDFGTGVMKVTPAHDAKDFEIGLKHNLKLNDIFADDGTVTSDIENFKGKHRLIVRQLLRKSLSEKGLYKEAKSHDMTIPFCSRTGDLVEARLKEQWYLDCTQLGKKAVDAVKSKKLRFIPEHHEKVWDEWFKHLKDWCISRQLWWGHQIPAYKILHKTNSQEKDLWVAATSNEEAIEKASIMYNLNPEDIVAKQDEDVLDTWFSSALYPLTSLGWPSEGEMVQKYYPLSLMETGFDILFFWVARMVMLGEHITGVLPFSEVLLHGMVCDSHGRKMTKSLGNTIDPIDVIEGISLDDLLQRVKDCQDTLTPEEFKTMTSAYKHNFPSGIPECGTDGLRLSLLTHDIQNQRINIDVKSIRVCRHFCNKIWQGFRLFTQAIEGLPKESLTPLTSAEVLRLNKNLVDRWILSRLAGLVSECNDRFLIHNFHYSAAAYRSFWVHSFCDVYIEYVKSVLAENKEKRLFLCRVMLTCIDSFLKTICPIMPYLSEELYQRLMFISNIEQLPSVTIAQYPTADMYSGWRDKQLEADMRIVTELVSVARSLKSKHGVNKLRPAVVIAVEDESSYSSLSPFSSLMVSLGKLGSVTFHVTQGQEFFEQYPQDAWVFQTSEQAATVIMDIREKSRFPDKNGNEMDKLRSELSNLNKMLSDSGYRKNAPLSVQEKAMAKKASLEGELQKQLNFHSRIESQKRKEGES